jgi:hypothetical protein
VFDSEAEGEIPPQFQEIVNSVGRVLVRLKLSPSGELLQATPVQTAGKDRPADATAEQSRTNFLITLPTHPVKVGDSWRQKYNVPVQASSTAPKLRREIPMQRVFELETIDGDLATIRVRTGSLVTINDPFIEAQLAQQMPNGKVVFDIAHGLLIEHSSEVDQAVLGAVGPNSRLQAVSSMIEKLMVDKPTETQAAKPREIESK